MDKLNLKYEKNIEYAKRAKKFIPGGAHTYSKGDDQYPANAPKIIRRGKGCYLWDVDDNQFLDFGMSLGTVVLGHAYDPVIDAARKELKNGANFVRPSFLEGELAELIHDIVPSAEMVKLAKHGSDATTAAIKMARAYTGRKYIVRCSDDPFNAVHDWFIGSTVIKRGIPEEVQKLTLQFKYNDLQGLQNLVDQYPNQISCVLLEPLSFIEPKDDFLHRIKDLCEKNGIVLIFDEVVSGFRFALGGVQEMLGVVPHLTALGKAMANGFSVSALVGCKEIMSLGGIDHDEERTFLLSTTHGGETHALAACIKTIEEIRDKNIIKHFWDVGEKLQTGIIAKAKEFDAEKYIHVAGYGCKPAFAFKDESGEISNVARTLFLQETIARGLLFPYVVPSYAHKDEHIDQCVHIVGEVLKIMKEAAETTGMKEQVQGHIVKPVFRQFN